MGSCGSNPKSSKPILAKKDNDDMAQQENEKDKQVKRTFTVILSNVKIKEAPLKVSSIAFL